VTDLAAHLAQFDREEAQRELVLRQLTHKLGPLAPEQHALISGLSASLILQLAAALRVFLSAADLDAWLDQIKLRYEYARRYGFGWNDGCREERRKLTVRLLTQRVGTLSPELSVRVERLGMAALLDLFDAVSSMHSEDDLRVWLNHSPYSVA
jgi:hypothetical protein